MNGSRIVASWLAVLIISGGAFAQTPQSVNIRGTITSFDGRMIRVDARGAGPLAGRQPDALVVGVCNITTAGGRDLSAVSEATAGAAPSRTDSLPTSKGDAGEVSCEQLSKDAAQITLMLVEVRRWYQKQLTVDQEKILLRLLPLG